MICPKACNLYYKLTRLGETLAMPLLLLVIRLYLAKDFFLAGRQKFDDIPGAIDLFKEEYNVPILPPELATYMAMGAELLLPVLLAIGLGSRFAAAGLFILVGVIELSYFHAEEHYYWFMLLGLIWFGGAGKLSLDYVLGRKCTKHD